MPSGRNRGGELRACLAFCNICKYPQDLYMERTKPRSPLGSSVPVVPKMFPCALAVLREVSPIILLMDAGTRLLPGERGYGPAAMLRGLWGAQLSLRTAARLSLRNED